MSVKIICPYVQENEIGIHKQRLWNLPIYYEKDHAMIGSDRMYQKLWNKFPKDDIFILHADMLPPQDDEDNVLVFCDAEVPSYDAMDYEPEQLIMEMEAAPPPAVDPPPEKFVATGGWTSEYSSPASVHYKVHIFNASGVCA